MRITRDIQSLSEFKRHTAKYLQQIEETGEPLILTVNGRARYVVQEAAAFEEYLRHKDYHEAVGGVRKGLDEMRRGEGRDAADAFAEFEGKHGIASE